MQADNKKWGVINNKGQYIINPIYDNGDMFFNHGKDLFITINNDSNGDIKSYTIYIVDKTGKVLKTFNYDISKDKIFKIPFISNNTYNNYIPTIYADITQNNQSYKVGYMDENGNMIIKPQFKLAEDFVVDNMAPVLVDKMWGLIDKTGKIVVNPQFDDVMLKYAFGDRWVESSVNDVGNIEAQKVEEANKKRWNIKKIITQTFTPGMDIGSIIAKLTPGTPAQIKRFNEALTNPNDPYHQKVLNHITQMVQILGVKAGQNISPKQAQEGAECLSNPRCPQYTQMVNWLQAVINHLSSGGKQP